MRPGMPRILSRALRNRSPVATSGADAREPRVRFLLQILPLESVEQSPELFERAIALEAVRPPRNNPHVALHVAKRRDDAVERQGVVLSWSTDRTQVEPKHRADFRDAYVL